MAILSTENGSVSQQTFWGVSRMRMKQTDCLQTRDQNRTKYTYTAQTRLRVVQYPAYQAIFQRMTVQSALSGRNRTEHLSLVGDNNQIHVRSTQSVDTQLAPSLWLVS